MWPSDTSSLADSAQIQSNATAQACGRPGSSPCRPKGGTLKPCKATASTYTCCKEKKNCGKIEQNKSMYPLGSNISINYMNATTRSKKTRHVCLISLFFHSLTTAHVPQEATTHLTEQRATTQRLFIAFYGRIKSSQWLIRTCNL